MGRRVLSALLAGGVLVGALGSGVPASRATDARPIVADLTVSTDVVYRREGHRYPVTLAGAVQLASDLACTPCQLRIGLWAPESDAPWRSQFFEDLTPGEALSDVQVDAVIYGSSSLPDGVHQVRVQVRDELGTLLATVEAAELGVYRLVRTPVVSAPATLLQGRVARVRLGFPWLAADGHREPYDGPYVRATVWRKAGTGWHLVKKTGFSRSHPHRRLDAELSRTTRWRLVVDAPGGELVSRRAWVRVWRQTGEFALRRVRVDTSRMSTSGLLVVRGRGVARYEDGEWHAPLPDTMVAVQFRAVGSREWRTVKRRPVEGRRFLAETSPWVSGYWRVKLHRDTSHPVRVTVR